MNNLIKLGLIGSLIFLYFYINKNKDKKIEVWKKIKKEEIVNNGNQNKITFVDGKTKLIDNPKSFIPSSIDWKQTANELLAQDANQGYSF